MTSMPLSLRVSVLGTGFNPGDASADSAWDYVRTGFLIANIRLHLSLTNLKISW